MYGDNDSQYLSASTQIKTTRTYLQSVTAWVSGATSGQVTLSKDATSTAEYVIPVVSGVSPSVVTFPDGGLAFPEGLYVKLESALASVSYW